MRLKHSFTALGLAVALAACGGGSDSEPASKSAGSGTVDKTATMRIGFTAPPTQLDPHKERPQDRVYLYAMYDRLFSVDAEQKVQPMLATAWKYSADGTQLDVTLREGVTFSDGAPVDAAAVKASIERGKTLEGSTVTKALSTVKTVEAVDDKTVRLVLSKANVSLPAVLAQAPGIVLNPAVMSRADLGRNTEGAGSGPYVVKAFTPNERVQFAPRPDGHWDPEAGRLAQLEIVSMPQSATRMNAVRSGDLESIYVKQDQATEATALGDGEAHEFTQYDSLLHYALMLRNTRPALADVRVRQAIAHAIDKKGISEGLLDGNCVTTSQPWPASHWAHDEALEDVQAHDVPAAKALLQQAGASGLELKVAVNAGLSPQNEILQVVQSQLQEVGVKVAITPLESATALEEFRAGNYDAYLHVINGEPDPAQLVGNYLTGGYALAGTDSAGLTTVAEQALAMTDQDARATAYRQVAQQVSERVWYVPLCFQPAMMLYPGDVIGADDLPLAWTGIFDPRHLARSGS